VTCDLGEGEETTITMQRRKEGDCGKYSHSEMKMKGDYWILEGILARVKWNKNRYRTKKLL
jgi:hypothetical protein